MIHADIQEALLLWQAHLGQTCRLVMYADGSGHVEVLHEVKLSTGVMWFSGWKEVFAFEYPYELTLSDPAKLVLDKDVKLT